MAAPVSIGQVAAETNRKRRRKKRPPPTESEVVNHLWEVAKATVAPPTPARVARSTRMTAEERSARKGAKRRAVEARREAQKAGLTARYRSSSPRIPRRADREGMPASVLHTPEAEAWQARQAQNDSGSWLSEIGQAAGALGTVADFAITGGSGRYLYEHPNVLSAGGGLALAGLIPVVGRAGRIGTEITEAALRTAVGGKRVDRYLGYGQNVPAALHPVGRALERATDRYRPEAGFVGHRVRAGKEIDRTLRNERIVKGSTGKALGGMRLSIPEQVAVRAIIEETPIADRIAKHRAAAVGKGWKVKNYHAIHIRALEKAAKLVDETDDYEWRLRAIADRVKAAEKPSETVPPELWAAERNGMTWREFSRARGYTDEEIADFQKWLDTYHEGRARGYSEDDLIAIAEGWVEPARLTSSSAKVQEAVRLVIESGLTREQIIRDLGENLSGLTEAMMKARKAAPARVFSHGAKWEPELKLLLGGEDVEAGLAHISYERGIPGLGVRHPFVSLFGRQGKGSVTRMLARDPKLNNAFTAKSIESGFYSLDTTGAVARSNANAVRLDAVNKTREKLLPYGVEAKDFERMWDAGEVDPAEWQALMKDPTKSVSERVRNISKLLDEGNIDPKLLDKDMEDVLRSLQDEMLPKQVSEILNSKAAENYKFVPKDVIEGVFWQSALRGRQMPRIAREIGGGLNDILRLAFLYLNPSYYFVNGVSNLALGVMHQGWALPQNIKRSVFLANKMRPENMVVVDGLTGNSLSHVLGGEGRHLTHWVVGPISDFAHIMVDRLPRRAAFFHEAGRAGYKGVKEVEKLIDDARMGNAKAMEDLDSIGRRANDAMVDFGRLSPLERNYVAKAVFFYPWVKGATRYTTRMVYERPYQSAMLAYMGYRQQEARKDLGPGPWYTQDLIEIPGIDKVIRLSTVLPPSTLIDIGRAVYGAATGKSSEEAPDLMSPLNPLIETAISFLTGRGHYGEELSPAERFTGYGLYKQFPWTRTVEQWNKTPEERADQIYPREHEDVVMQRIFGSLAPTPYNRDVAAERVAKTLPEFSAVRKDVQWAKDHPDMVSPEVVPYAVEYRQSTEAISAGEEALKKDLGVDKLSPQQEAAVKLNVLLQRRPELLEGTTRDQWRDGFRQVFKFGLSKDISDYVGALNGLLEYEDVLGSRVTTVIDNAQQLMKDKQKATRLAS